MDGKTLSLDLEKLEQNHKRECSCKAFNDIKDIEDRTLILSLPKLLWKLFEDAKFETGKDVSFLIEEAIIWHVINSANMKFISTPSEYWEGLIKAIIAVRVGEKKEFHS